MWKNNVKYEKIIDFFDAWRRNGSHSERIFSNALTQWKPYHLPNNFTLIYAENGIAILRCENKSENNSFRQVYYPTTVQNLLKDSVWNEHWPEVQPLLDLETEKEILVMREKYKIRMMIND